MKIVYILSVFILAFFSACGKDGSLTGKTATSCLPIPKDFNKGEYAQYRIITDMYQKIVSAKIDDITDEAYILTFDNNGTITRNYELSKKCIDTASMNKQVDYSSKFNNHKKLKNEEAYIISGSLFVDISKYDGVDINISSEFKNDYRCSHGYITVAAGGFEAQKCITTYDDNRTIIKEIISYMMSKTSKSRPFYGHIKDIIILKDGTTLSSELINWNSL